MNTAVRDIQQYKQQFVVRYLRVTRPGARTPTSFAAFVRAIAAFFAVVPRLYASAPVHVAKFVISRAS